MKENKFSDLKKMKLNGNVKSIEEISYIPKVINGNIKKYFRKRMNFNEDDFKIYFNTHGYIIEDIRYFNLDGSVMSKNEFFYDIHHNLIEERIYNYEYSYILKNKHISSYDINSNLIEKKCFNKDGIIESITRHKYNDLNQVIEDYEYSSEKTFKLKRSYKYDFNNFLIEETIHLGNFDRIFFYKNDLKGNCIETRTELSNGNIESIEKIKLDDSNNVLEYLCYKSDGSFDSKENFKYDANNNLIEHIWFVSESKYMQKVMTEYDKFSNIISATKFDFNGNILEKVTFNYKYDFNNNWIESVKFDQNNAPFVILERKFNYF